LAALNLGDSIGGLFAYAILATILAIVVLVWLGKIAGRIGGQAIIDREVEG
jgi:VIT1/CCC1 family predicted Fe2+/Mn2+ transporter